MPRIAAINETESSFYKYQKKVAVKITELSKESYESAAKKINSMKSVQIVNIQHEFGLFGGQYGEYILDFMGLLKKKIVTTFHTVLEEPRQKMLEVVKGIAEKSDRIVVMTETAKTILAGQYGIQPEKIVVIPHGVPAARFGAREKTKKKYGLEGKKVLLTFGLLSRGKGIESVINAMPEIIAKRPEAVYLVVGQTHPRVRAREGETYRQELMELSERKGVAKNVKFLDKYLSIREITECLEMADIYLAPSIDKTQICSGTVSYAMGAGKAIIASMNKYNIEVLSRGRGVIMKDNDPKKFARGVARIFSNTDFAVSLQKNAFEYSRKMTWQNVSTKYFNTFAELSSIEAPEFSRLPRVSFRHFSNLTDDFGMLQFANYSTPDQNSGYTLDDNARALIVSAKGYEKFGTKKMLMHAGTFLSFIGKCQLSDGRFHNMVDGNREFADDVGSEDSFGRAVLALGTAVKSGLPEGHRLMAKKILEKTIGAEQEIISPRAQADALIGLVNSRDFFSNGNGIGLKERLLESLISKYVETSDGKWNWFEKYLTYGNSRIPEALFEAHPIDRTGMASKIARESMDFLTSTLFIGGKLVPIGQEKWFMKDMERGLYDQQPIEAAGMTTACLKAHEKTSNADYLRKARESFDWFLGKNSASMMVYDEATGGCFDGITRSGVNANQGAESTISYLMARLSI